MNDPALPDPVLVTQTGHLAEVVAEIASEPVIAVDTESNSLFAYQEQVCLIQFSTPRADYLIDPLSLGNMSSLGSIFADPQREKVFHAAEYDVSCLKRDFGYEFTNLFDTMIAARILGRRAVGLGSILKDEFKVQLNKRYQRANWGQRPLPPHLLAYARLDTRFLIPLRQKLKSELEVNGRLPIAVEDFARICEAEARPPKTTENEPWRINGAQELSPQQLAVLQELCNYRDRIARSLDRPLFKVIGDRTLLEIATVCPRDGAALRRIPGMTSRRVRRHEAPLLKAVKRGLRAPPPVPPREPRPDGGFIARRDALRTWRKSKARKMGVNSDVVLPRELMVAIANEAPSNAEALAEILRVVPWRRSRFGAEIWRLLSQLENLE